MYPLSEKETTSGSARQQTPGGRRVDFRGAFRSETDPAGLRRGSPRRSLAVRQGLWDWTDQPYSDPRLSPRACLNRQAGFTAARPAAKSWLRRQPIEAIVANDRTLLTGALNGQLSGSARTCRLVHAALTQL